MSSGVTVVSVKYHQIRLQTSNFFLLLQKKFIRPLKLLSLFFICRFKCKQRCLFIDPSTVPFICHLLLSNDSLTKTKRKQNTNSTDIHFRVLKPLKNIKPFRNYCELHIRDFSLLYICWTAYFNFISYPKIDSKRVTQLRLYRIVLNDSRLWGRVKNVEEIFDKHYIWIVKISNQINWGRTLTKRSWIQDDYIACKWYENGLKCNICG